MKQSIYLYQKKQRYFAQIAGGLEEPAKNELINLGSKNVSLGFKGAYFEADNATLYRVNYAARMVSRVLAPLISFTCSSRHDLYRLAGTVDWCSLFSLDQTFAVFANVANSNIIHSQFAALCLKDAIVDAFRDRYGQRPNVDPKLPDIWINLHLLNNRATISLDTSGGPLHRRGYRRQSVTAPMQETLAAGIIELTQWQGQRPLYDPMCGSGTLLCEALINYCRVPAGVLREHYGFQRLPDFEPGVWLAEKKKLDERRRPLPSGLVCGSDYDSSAVRAARKNCRLLPCGRNIDILTQSIEQVKSLEERVIVCNPPYGIRLQSEKNMADFYKRLGDFLKQRCKGAEAYVYFGERKWLKSIGLKPAWKKALRNGGLDGRLAKYDLY